MSDIKYFNFHGLIFGDPITHPVPIVQAQTVFILIRLQGIPSLRVNALFFQIADGQISQVLYGLRQFGQLLVGFTGEVDRPFHRH